MNLLDVLKTAALYVLQAVIIAGVPSMIAYVIFFIRAKAGDIKMATKNDHIANVIDTVSGIVEKSVEYVAQTYVDNLKKDGKFNIEEHGIAFDKAFDRVVGLVSEEYHDVIESVFGNFAFLVETLIESAVRGNKPQEKLPVEIVL